MEKKDYEILNINKDKEDLRKSIGKVGLSVLVLGAGVVGMRYAGEAFINRLYDDTPMHTIVALCGYGSLTAASLLTATGGGALMAKSIPEMKSNIAKVKADNMKLKLTK